MYIVVKSSRIERIENLGFQIYRKAVCERFGLLDSYRSNDNLKGQGSVTYRTEYKYIEKQGNGGENEEKVTITATAIYDDLDGV